MKKNFLCFLLLCLAVFLVKLQSSQKTCLVPLSDAYPNRYFYHTPFQYDQFDVAAQWLCKGNCTLRYQTLKGSDMLTSFLFDNPMIATANGANNTYNGGVLGLGFQNILSKSTIDVKRNSFFVDCTVEVTKLNVPFYLHIGIPIQRTQQEIIFSEIIQSDEAVIKGGFVKEYQSTASITLDAWENTPSPIVTPLPGMKAYLEGASIGNMSSPLYGKLPPYPMTLWALADIYLQIGYDGWCYKKTNFGYYGRVVIPTSPTLKSVWNQYMFYPTIGNVDRWEWGIGINGNSLLYDSDSQSYTLHFDGYVGYLAPSWHMRPFDLQNGFFTRYGQVKIFDREAALYKNINIRAIDITTLTYQIGNCVKSELVFDMVWRHYQSFWNVGYSLKTQSGEKMRSNEYQVDKIFGAQAVPFMYGFSSQQYVQTPNPDPSTTESMTCNLITPDSGMTFVATGDSSHLEESGSINGVLINFANEMKKDKLDMTSALMPTQLLNILFLGYSYEKINSLWNIIFGIKGAISFSPRNYYTPAFYEGVIFLELDY